MLKEISILAVAVLALAGCDSKSANAQNTGTVVGNPDSSNVLIMEEGYKAVVVPAQNGNAVGNPHYSEQAAANPQNNNNNDTPAAANNSANANAGTVSVDETVTGVTDGNGNGIYEVDETVSD